MFNTRQNFHRSKLPALGTIGQLIVGVDRYRGIKFLHGDSSKYIVESFPLCDKCAAVFRWYSHRERSQVERWQTHAGIWIFYVQ